MDDSAHFLLPHRNEIDFVLSIRDGQETSGLATGIRRIGKTHLNLAERVTDARLVRTRDTLKLWEKF